MKSIKILTILVVAVMSVSLLAKVERPDKVPKAFEAIWNALVHLQEQTDQEVADRGADVDGEEAARIAADNALKILLEAAIASGDTATADAAQAANDALQAQIDAIPVLPAGVIVMWYGGAIPEGWALCDGSEGTPDLSDKFICGSDGGDLGTTGGSSTYSLTVSQLPTHNHKGTTTFDGAHAHHITLGDGTGNFLRPWALKSLNKRSYGTDGSDPLTHRHSVIIEPRGGGSSIDNRPDYYKLAFIMKL